jgi:hypothetical protein
VNIAADSRKEFGFAAQCVQCLVHVRGLGLKIIAYADRDGGLVLVRRSGKGKELCNGAGAARVPSGV